MFVALTLLGISALVVLHELGHLCVARACGMRVLRFSIGFGPTLLAVQRGGIVWQLAALPLGGFVQIDGMAGEAEPPAGADAPPKAPEEGEPQPPGSPGVRFDERPIWQRFLVILAGPASNWLTSAVLLMALAATTGFSQFDATQARLGELTPGGPAARAGLRDGDTVLSIDGATVRDWEGLVGVVRSSPGHPLSFVVQRDAARLEVVVTPEAAAPGGQGMLQALPHATQVRLGLWQSVGAGLSSATRLTLDQGRMLLGMLNGTSSGRLTGLPGIVRTVSQQASQALHRLFEQLAYISIGLCLLNLAPIPALDGSRLVFLALEAIRRRPLDARIEGVLHTAGLVLLLGVMAFVTVRDLL